MSVNFDTDALAINLLLQRSWMSLRVNRMNKMGRVCVIA